MSVGFVVDGLVGKLPDNEDDDEVCTWSSVESGRVGRTDELRGGRRVKTPNFPHSYLPADDDARVVL